MLFQRNHQKLQNQWIHVYHHHVDRMQFAESKVHTLYANARQNIKEILTKDVDQNVWSVRIVRWVELVYETNVEIHALVHVDCQLFVQFPITYQSVLVQKVMKEMLSLSARQLLNHHVSILYLFLQLIIITVPYSLQINRENISQSKLYFPAEVQDPCIPSPCGPNTQCRKVNDNAVCSCLPGFQGVASGTIGCRPECVISPDCPRNRACVNNKCVDPCPGVCGYLAVCHVVNHSPICSCPPQYNGDPFVECQQIPGKLLS